MEFAIPAKSWGKPHELMTPSKREEFFYARLHFSDGRRCTWNWRAILGVGVYCRSGRRTFPSGNASGERYGIVRYRVICRIHGSRRTVSCVTPSSSILHDWPVRRLYHVFIIQLTNARSRPGWRLVQRLPERGALICLLYRGGMAWTHSCSRTIAEIETSHAPSRRRCPPADFCRRKR